MKTLGISQFKAKALQVINEVARTQERIVITKRGKPLAQLMPYREEEGRPAAGKLAELLLFEQDILTPLGEEMWDACQ